MILAPFEIYNSDIINDAIVFQLDNYIKIDMYDIKLSSGTGNVAWFINDEGSMLLRIILV